MTDTNPYVDSPLSSGYVQASQLDPTTKMNIAPAPVDTTDYASIINGATSTFQQTDKALNDNQTNVVNPTLSSLAQLYKDVGLKSADTAQMEQEKGINTMQTDVQNLTNTVNGLQTEANFIPLQMQNYAQGKGMTDRGLAPLQTAALRNNAIQTLTATSLLQAKQGNLTLAMNQIDRAIQLKYAPKEAEIAAKEKQLELNNKYFTTPTEKKRAEALQIRYDKEKQDLADKKAEEKAVNDLLINASQVAPQDVMARAQAIKDKGGSATQVAMALGEYGKDYLQNQLLKEQIKLARANTNKVESETVKIDNANSVFKQDNNGVVQAPNGDQIGLPNKTLESISKLKLNEGQANAVAFVARMIQSNKAINKQIGSIKGGVIGGTTGYNPTTVVSGLGRTVGSDSSREYMRNAEDFIRAQLRKESGAMISDEEIAGGIRLYMAQGFGQDEKDIAETQKKRDSAIKSMIAQAGPAAPHLQQYYEQSKVQGDAFVSANPQLNTWYAQTAGAVQNSTAQSSSSYGFTDNQMK